MALRVLAGFGILGAAFATPSRRQASEGQGGLLKCFQIAQPVLGPEGVTPSWGRETPAGDGQGECEMLLMEHSFGASYGQPFVGMFWSVTQFPLTPQTALNIQRRTSAGA